jgi:TMEM175 potassium channel family protein
MMIWKQRTIGLENSRPKLAAMKTTRLEAFSDGVLAIIITIMVLELKVPHAVELAALKPVLPVLLSYVLSFIYLGIYWNNHHHLFQATEEVSGGILWANLHLLFWLSLFPFTTAWMGENHLAAIPTAIYGFVLLMAAIAYYVLQRSIMAKEGRESLLAQAVGKDWKGKLSPLLYLAAIPLAFVSSWIAGGLYVFAALLWLIPDPRIEREIEKREE